MPSYSEDMGLLGPSGSDDDSYDQSVANGSENGRRRSLAGSPQGSALSGHSSCAAAIERPPIQAGGSPIQASWYSHPIGRAGSVFGNSEATNDAFQGPRNEVALPDAPHLHMSAACDVTQMPGYESVLLGEGVTMVPPEFQQGRTNSSGWVLYSEAGLPRPLVPVRAMCFNVPAEAFSLDATKFTDWQTPMNNSVRVAAIAALLGLVAAPLSKGFLYVRSPSTYPAQTNSNSDVLTGQDRTRRWRGLRRTPRTTMKVSAAAKSKSQSALTGT